MITPDHSLDTPAKDIQLDLDYLRAVVTVVSNKSAKKTPFLTELPPSYRGVKCYWKEQQHPQRRTASQWNSPDQANSLCPSELDSGGSGISFLHPTTTAADFLIGSFGADSSISGFGDLQLQQGEGDGPFFYGLGDNLDFGIEPWNSAFDFSANTIPAIATTSTTTPNTTTSTTTTTTATGFGGGDAATLAADGEMELANALMGGVSEGLGGLRWGSDGLGNCMPDLQHNGTFPSPELRQDNSPASLPTSTPQSHQSHLSQHSQQRSQPQPQPQPRSQPQPQNRGHKRPRHTPSNNTPGDDPLSSPELDADPEDTAAVKVQKRQRNTLAARKYRQKRLDRIKELEDALETVSKERDDLKLKLARQEAESETLRGMMGMTK
ncbi:Cross-pathway control protein 1 [Zalerion maritima]|uniref:Cross-pathway control protein 1 n=1 Tax=Zalerion maritima TaxID=339359 RepID=A0AAD5RZ78_9PEZI|nr:Cross-pathway control protein 1 [Zalerion maritima]